LEYLVKKNDNLIVNLSTETGYSVLQAIQKAEEITNKKIKYDIVGRREGDPDNVYASFKKAKDLLDWEAQYSDLETILTSMWDIYK
jgi:UDP-glucose 4-epimerase